MDPVRYIMQRMERGKICETIVHHGINFQKNTLRKVIFSGKLLQHLKELIKLSKFISILIYLLNIQPFLSLPIKKVENLMGDDITHIISI